MKQLSLIAIICCLLSASTKAATVGGTVTYTSTSAPVANQIMYISDSLRTFNLLDTTSATGTYSVTLPAGVSTGTVIHVTTAACGVMQLNSHTYTGSSITSNFSICSSTAVNLNGTVSLGSSANNDLTVLYLIRKQYDLSLMDTTLVAIDSFYTSRTGGTYSYSGTFSSTVIGPNATLLLKAALDPSHASYSGYLPTYYTSSISWTGATALTSANFSPSVATNISMIAGTNPGGPGFVGGSVLLGANKSTAVGDPLSGRILILTKSTGQPVAYTYSDGTGQFQFSNLAYGSYKLFGDVMGKSNPALAFTISASQPGISNITFEENSNSFDGHIGNLSVNKTSAALNAVSVYPNPVKDFVQLSGLTAISGDKRIVLTDLRGAILTEQSVPSGQNAHISLATLPAGLYLLQLQTEAGNASFRISK
jgi:hypothetical protein